MECGPLPKNGYYQNIIKRIKAGMNNEQSTIVNNDYKYKIVFVGDASVGKTSLVEHILFGYSKPTYQPTICLQSAKKIVIHNNQVYRLMLWDTAGQEKFNSLIPSFVRGCDCAVVVYDVTNQESLKNCQKWIKLIHENNNQQAPALLVANKTDLAKAVAPGQGFELAIKHKFSHLQASARTGAGIEQLVSQIVQTIQKNRFKSQKQTRSTDSDLNSSRKISISNTKIAPEITLKKSSNCCSI